MNISNKWKDYECMKTGNGEKLERWKRRIYDESICIQKMQHLSEGAEMAGGAWDCIWGTGNRGGKSNLWRAEGMACDEWVPAEKVF